MASSHSRNSSSNDHRPAQPSALRQAFSARHDSSDNREDQGTVPSPPTSPGPASRAAISYAFASESTPLIQGQPDSSNSRRNGIHPAHPGVCSHGTFSPRPSSPTITAHSIDDDGSDTAGSGTHIPVLDDAITTIVGHDDWKRWLKHRIRTKKMGHSRVLAEQAGFEDTTSMCVLFDRPQPLADHGLGTWHTISQP